MFNQMRDIRMPKTVQGQLFRQPSFGAKLGKSAIKITPRDASPSLGNPNSIEFSWIKPITALFNPLSHTRNPPIEFWNWQGSTTSRRTIAGCLAPSHMQGRIAAPLFSFGIVLQIRKSHLRQFISSLPKCVSRLEYLRVSKRGQRAFLP